VQVSGFEEVYEAEYVRMVRVAAMLTGSTARAEQVVQDAYVALHPRFDSAADPADELYRAVVEAGRSCGDTAIPWTALADLTPQGRAVVVLRYYAGLHPTEIAAVLGRSVGTVQATLDAAGDEAGHRQRLVALAVTIAVRPGWALIRDRLDAAPASARRRGVLVPSRLGRLAGAAAAVVIAAALVIAAAVVIVHPDHGGIEARRDTPSTTTTTRLRTRSATNTADAPPGAAATPADLLAEVPPTGGMPSYDLPRALDMLGLGLQDGAADDGDMSGGDEGTAGGTEWTEASAPEPQPEPGPTLDPSAPPAETPPITAPLVHVRTPAPPERGPDGWLVAQSTYYGYAGWFILTYNVDGDVFSFAEWIVDEYAEPVAVDNYSFSLRPGENCLVTGAASDYYPLGLVPYRFVAGVVRSDAVQVEVVGGVSGLVYEQSIRADLGPEVAPGLRSWMTTVLFDYLRVDVRDADGTIIHTASPAQREAFPDRC
jgi:Sigma-70, region 4